MLYLAMYRQVKAVKICSVFLCFNLCIYSSNGLYEFLFARFKRRVFFVLFFLLGTHFSLFSKASTQAGTTVDSTAIVTFDVNGVTNTATTSVQFLVQEIIDVSQSWTDANNVLVNSPANRQLSNFIVRNDGNGNESFSIRVDNVANGIDQFDFDLINGVKVYLENGMSAGFQMGDDTLYSPGLNDPLLAADSMLVVYVLADIPTGQIISAQGQLALTVSSTSVDSNGTAAAGSPAGTTLVNEGEGGTDAIVGASLAQTSEVAIYEVSGARVNVFKEIVEVRDPLGGSLYMTGSLVTYRIAVTGRENEPLTIVDPIPENTRYLPNTITLNGAVKTDGGGDDEADFNLSQPDAVTVVFANIPGSAANIIEFSVTID